MNTEYQKKIDLLKNIVNDNMLFGKAIEMARLPKVKPSNLQGKNNYIYNLLHTELHYGLDLINKSLKKPASNSMIFFNDKNSTVINKLNKILEDDSEDRLIVCLIMLQTEKEKNINFKPTVI